MAYINENRRITKYEFYKKEDVLGLINYDSILECDVNINTVYNIEL